MGAPDFKKHSNRIYYREIDPIPFWSQFTVFAVIGVTAAYLSINWRKARPALETLEEQDRMYLDSVGAERAKKIENTRVLQVVGLGLGLLVILGISISLLVLR